ncbi:MAG: glycosyltransferase family 4 protein [Candidatus Aenigmatarchaeota archaeon]
MNICIFSYSFLPRIGGMEWVVHNLANALSILGHNVVVLTKKVKEKDLDVKKLYKIEKFGFTFKGSTKIGLDFLYFLFKMYNVVKKYKIEVINFHSAAYSGVYTIAYKKFFNPHIPVVATLHGGDIQIIPEINYGYCLDKRWREKIINVLKNSDAIVAISGSVKNDIKNLVSNVINKVYDIPNGIWINEFLNHKIEKNIRDRFNLPIEAKVIISVGRNHVKKGFEYGIKAMKIISKKYSHSNIYYVIIGKDTKKLLSLVRELNLENKIILVEEIKERNELISCYLTSDIYLSPSLVEGFSLTNLEAMAAGLPCVITDVPGNRDVVKNNSGLLVPPQSPEKIAEAIINILSNENLRTQLKYNALKEVKKYDWIEIAKKYLTVFSIIAEKYEKNKY